MMPEVGTHGSIHLGDTWTLRSEQSLRVSRVGGGGDNVVAEAVGKWESRTFCGISKRSGKVVVTFPFSAFSTASFSANFPGKFVRRPVSQTSVRPLMVILFLSRRLTAPPPRQYGRFGRLPRLSKCGRSRTMCSFLHTEVLGNSQ
jgi:hypothetical protein